LFDPVPFDFEQHFTQLDQVEEEVGSGLEQSQGVVVRGLFETGGVDLVDLQFLGLLDVLKSFALRVIHAKHLQLSFYLFALLLVRLAVALA
jgi:hypothetical protein